MFATFFATLFELTLRRAFLIVTAFTCGLAFAQDPRIARFEQSLLADGIRDQHNAPMGLAAHMAHYKVPGMSVAVIENGRVLWAKAYGVRDAAGAMPVDTNTLFQAASLSKPVAAMTALALVESGELTLDGPINNQLRRWKIEDQTYDAQNRFLANAVSLRDVLSHKAGLGVGGFQGYATDAKIPAIEEILQGRSPANNSQVALVQPPGFSNLYSGGGYTVVQLAIEDARRSKFELEAARLVLNPLQMSRSTYARPGGADNFASAHTASQPIAGGYRMHPELAAAGLWSTPSDMARFALALARTEPGQPQAVSARLMASMRQSHGKPEYDFGLGVSIHHTESLRWFVHLGANRGYRASMWVAEGGKYGAVVMTNDDAGGGLAREVIQAVALSHEWPEFLPPPITTVPTTAEAIALWVGDYRLAPTRWLSVRESAGQLYARFYTGAARNDAPLVGAHPGSWERLHALAPNPADGSGAVQVGTTHAKLVRDAATGAKRLLTPRRGSESLQPATDRPIPLLSTAPVWVRGSFNDWALRNPLLLNETGGSATLQLSTGRHELKFASADFQTVDLGVMPQSAAIQPNAAPQALSTRGANVVLHVASAGTYTLEVLRLPDGDLAVQVKPKP